MAFGKSFRSKQLIASVNSEVAFFDFVESGEVWATA
jgi:hypothetical protein